MFKPVIRLLLFAIVLIAASCSDDDSKPKKDPNECLTMKSASHGQPIDGRYIVSFSNDDQTNGRTAKTAARVFANHRISSEKIIERIDGELSNYVLTLTSQEADQLKNDEDVKLVEPDRIISICSCFTVVDEKLVTWNADRVGYGDGTGKTAWILDSGIDPNHPDLNVDKTRSRSFIDGDPSPNDTNGHGTHVAGIIGAKNNDIGTLGIASGATLVGLKVLDNIGEGKLSTTLKALSYVRSSGKAGDVVNISMTLQEVSEILEQEIKGVANRGMFVAIAAGNGGLDASNFSPARTSGNNIYTVAAVDSLNHFAGFSNFGSVIDFAAPGVRILSSYSGNRYAYMSGTSMATPHVAGLLLINNGKINSDGLAIDDPDGKPDPIAHK